MALEILAFYHSISLTISICLSLCCSTFRARALTDPGPKFNWEREKKINYIHSTHQCNFFVSQIRKKESQQNLPLLSLSLSFTHSGQETRWYPRSLQKKIFFFHSQAPHSHTSTGPPQTLALVIPRINNFFVAFFFFFYPHTFTISFLTEFLVFFFCFSFVVFFFFLTNPHTVHPRVARNTAQG